MPTDIIWTMKQIVKVAALRRQGLTVEKISHQTGLDAHRIKKLFNLLPIYKICARADCGKQFEIHRSDMEYCSNRCRNAEAWRRLYQKEFPNPNCALDNNQIDEAVELHRKGMTIPQLALKYTVGPATISRSIKRRLGAAPGNRFRDVVCAACGKQFTGTFSSKYCSSTCRNKGAYERRKGQARG